MLTATTRTHRLACIGRLQSGPRGVLDELLPALQPKLAQRRGRGRCHAGSPESRFLFMGRSVILAVM